MASTTPNAADAPTAAPTPGGGSAAAAAGEAAPTLPHAVDELTMIAPDDWHLHLRDGERLHSLLRIPLQCKRAIIMPNLKPPVVTTDLALAYRERIVRSLPEGSRFEPLMTLYLTDQTTPEEIVKAKATGAVFACKLYPAGATTNSDSGVTDIRKIYPTLRQMAKSGILLLVHGEVVDADVDFFDREAVFIERHLKPLVAAMPQLKIVMEHITTKDAVEFVQAAGDNVAATVTAHHLMYNRNVIFNRGLNPHFYCLPILKRETHRRALVAAATAGSPKFFIGSDSAPHPVGAKESACGCAGCFTAHATVALYAETFDAVGAMGKLEAFCSLNGPRFYGLKPNAERVRLVRQAVPVPETFQFGDSVVRPLRAGQTVAFSFEYAKAE